MSAQLENCREVPHQAWRSSESIYGTSVRSAAPPSEDNAWKSLDSLDSHYATPGDSGSRYDYADVSSESIYGTIRVSDSKRSAILSCPFGNYAKVPKAGKPVSIPLVPSASTASASISSASTASAPENPGNLSEDLSRSGQKLNNPVSSEMNLLESMVTTLLRVDSDPIISELASIHSGSSSSESSNLANKCKDVKEKTMSLGRCVAMSERRRDSSVTSSSSRNTSNSNSEGGRDAETLTPGTGPESLPGCVGGPRSIDSGISVSDLTDKHAVRRANKVKRVRSLTRPRVPPPPPPSITSSKGSSGDIPSAAAGILTSNSQPLSIHSFSRVPGVGSTTSDSQQAASSSRAFGGGSHSSSVASNGTLRPKQPVVVGGAGLSSANGGVLQAPPPLPPCRTSSLKRGFSLDARRTSARIGMSSLRVISSSSSRDAISAMMAPSTSNNPGDRKPAISKAASSVYASPAPLCGQTEDVDDGGPTYASPVVPKPLHNTAQLEEGGPSAVIHRRQVATSSMRTSAFKRASRDEEASADKREGGKAAAMNDDIPPAASSSIKRVSSFNPSTMLKDLSAPLPTQVPTIAPMATAGVGGGIANGAGSGIGSSGSPLQVAVEANRRPDDIRLLPRVLASSKRTPLRRAEDPFRLSFSESHSSLSSVVVTSEDSVAAAAAVCYESPARMFGGAVSSSPMDVYSQPLPAAAGQNRSSVASAVGDSEGEESLAARSPSPPPLPTTSPPPLTPTSPSREFQPAAVVKEPLPLAGDLKHIKGQGKKVPPPLPPVRNPETKISSTPAQTPSTSHNSSEVSSTETSNANDTTESLAEAESEDPSFNKSLESNEDVDKAKSVSTDGCNGRANAVPKALNGGMSKSEKLFTCEQNSGKTSATINGGSVTKQPASHTSSIVAKMSASKKSTTTSLSSTFGASLSSILSASSVASSKLLRATSSAKELKNPLKLIDKKCGRQATSASQLGYHVTVRSRRVDSADIEDEDLKSSRKHADKENKDSNTNVNNLDTVKNDNKDDSMADNHDKEQTAANDDITKYNEVVTESSDTTNKHVNGADTQEDKSVERSSTCTTDFKRSSVDDGYSVADFKRSSCTDDSVADDRCSVSKTIHADESVADDTSSVKMTGLLDSTYTISSSLASTRSRSEQNGHGEPVDLLHISKEIPKTGFDFLDNW